MTPKQGHPGAEEALLPRIAAGDRARLWICASPGTVPWCGPRRGVCPPRRGTLSAELANPGILEQILLYHVASESGLSDNPLKTVQGEKLFASFHFSPSGLSIEVPAIAAIDVIRDGIEILGRHPLIGRPCEDGLRELMISYGKSGYVALWAPAGHVPGVDEGPSRLWRLDWFGPTREAFTFKVRFPAPNLPGALKDMEPDPWCMGRA